MRKLLAMLSMLVLTAAIGLSACAKKQEAPPPPPPPAAAPAAPADNAMQAPADNAMQPAPAAPAEAPKK
jgi:hypothetical protein